MGCTINSLSGHCRVCLHNGLLPYLEAHAQGRETLVEGRKERRNGSEHSSTTLSDDSDGHSLRYRPRGRQCR